MAVPEPGSWSPGRPRGRPGTDARRRTHLLGALLAALLLWVALAAGRAGAADPVSSPAEAGDGSRFLDEPVFGSRVHVREAGRGHPFSVVLVHGLGADASQVWDGLVPVLSQRYHVVTADLPGFGRSSKPDALYSPSAYAAFLKWLVEQTVEGRFALVGHSLGGAIALRYAAETPDRLDRLLLVDVAGVLHRLALTRDLLTPDLVDRMPWAPSAPLHALEDLVRSAVERLPNVPLDLGVVLKTPYLRQKILSADPTRVAALALAEEDFSAAFGRARAPTLVLWGERDKVASRRTGTLLAACLPRARLQLIPEAGHEPMREQPAAFNAAVLDWLSAEPAAPSSSASPASKAPSDRVGTCKGRKGAIFTGEYRRIEVDGCTDVRIEGATAESVAIEGSMVQMEHCRIRGGDVGISVRRSTLVATGVRVDARDALVVSDSRVDLAGVELVGERAAVRVEEPERLLFSVSRVRSPHTDAYLHGPREVTPEAPL